MKRALLAPALLIFAAACGQSTSRPPARLSGTHSVVTAGALAFVTSTDRDELRVIDGVKGDFVRAPNPLEPLAIPVVDTPTDIARDFVWSYSDPVRYATRSVGQYVYAFSRGGPEISAVGTDPGSLREEVRINVRFPITAVAALGPEGASTSTLIIATYFPFVGSAPPGAQLHTVSVPAMTGELQTVGQGDVKVVPGSFLVDESIVALAVLPPPMGKQIVYATRATGPLGTTDVYVASLDNPGARTSLLERASCPAKTAQPDARCGFSHPVRELEIDDRDLNSIRVFGLLDDDSCADDSCSGIEIVEITYDEADRSKPRFVELARDVTGFPMARFKSTGGLFTGFDITRGGANCAPGADCTTEVEFPGFTAQYKVLGLATQGNGDILVFEGEERRLVDVDTAGPSAGVGAHDLQGALLPDSPSNIELGDGAAVRETVEIVLGGKLHEGATSPYTVPAEKVSQVEANDELVLHGPGGCEGQTLIITSATGGTLTTATTPQTGCAFEVLAGATSAHPFVVRGSVTGFMGRTALGQRFTFPPVEATDANVLLRLGKYYHHSGNVSRPRDTAGALKPLTDPSVLVPPMVAFTMPAANPGRLAASGDTYTLDIDPHYSLLNARINPATYPNVATYYVPTSVARSEATNRTYVTYPSTLQGPSILSIQLDTYSNGSFRIEPPYQ